MAKRLTQASVDRMPNARNPAGSVVTDGEVPGLRVAVGKRSSTYKLVAKVAGAKPVTVTIGRTDEISLADARDAARDLRLKMRRGIDPNVINELRKLHREHKAEMEKHLDDVDIDRVLENGTEAERHVLNKAYEATHVGDPLVKALDEVEKAADQLDRYVAKSMLHGETFEAAHDRLAEAGDPEYCRLYEATTSGRL